VTYEEAYNKEIEDLGKVGLPKIHSNLVKMYNSLSDLDSSDLKLTRKQWERINRLYDLLKELGI